MRDRQKVEAVLARRFPGASPDQVAAAANAIMGLTDEWEEVLHEDRAHQYHSTNDCGDVCDLALGGKPDVEFRLFRRRDG